MEVNGQRQATAALYPGNGPVPIVLEAGCIPKPLCKVADNFAPTLSDPGTVQPVNNRYTVHATQPHICLIV